MHSYASFFPARTTDDQLDVIPLLRQAFERAADYPVISFSGEIWTIGRLRGRVAAIQAWLRGQGIGAGQRVAVMLDNDADHVALIYALILSGIIWIPVNTLLKAIGIEYVLTHAAPDLFIGHEAAANEIHQACARSDFHHSMPAAVLSGLPDAGPSATLDFAALDSAATLCIIYTSGTTGAPKGVLFSHRMMRIATESVLQVADIRPGDRPFLWEPLCHIGGVQMLLVPFFTAACLYAVPRFSVSRFWKQAAAGRCTQVHYLGGILDMLLHAPVPPGEHTLRVGWGAGISQERWNAVKTHMRIGLRECYGMTECSSFATLNADDRPGSIGKALPWITVELLDDDGQPVPPGQRGQIVLSSQVEGALFPGYLDNPQATAAALRDGKLHTGDIGYQDEAGYLYFSGRHTDSIRVRGENVSAWEIERVVLMHPQVEQAAAVGVASDIGEQDIFLYVQWKQGCKERFEALSAWLRGRLASYQLPRYYAQVAQFEMTPSERIRKHLLPRDTHAAWDSRHHESSS